MKKAFTLIELLAVIIILAIVALIATPLILDVIEDAEISSNKSQVELLIDSAENLYGISKLNNENENLFDGTTNIYGNISTSGVKPENGSITVSSTGEVTIAVYMDGKCYSKIGNNDIVIEDKDDALDCAPVAVPPVIPETPDTGYTTGTIKSTDMISGDLVGVIIETDGTVKVADTTKEWFNYENKEWANAVILNAGVEVPAVGSTITSTDIKAYYVWIPRYEYQIFDTDADASDEADRVTLASTGGIKIRFTETGTTMPETPTIGEYYTHPAFTIDDGTTKTEIPGFWIGKFELTGTLENPTILPNTTSLRDYNVSQFFNSIAMLDGDSTETDSHMLKNMEWGAVAYLSYSTYGTCTETSCTEITVNSNSSYQTGGFNYVSNINQSTTGNIAGVYDMSGGTQEFVMLIMEDSTNQTLKYSNSGFTDITMPSEKYYNVYISSTSDSSYEHGQIGDATKETTQWNDDHAYFTYGGFSLFVRGGSATVDNYSGLFNFRGNSGMAHSSLGSRAALWVYPE